MPGPVDPNAPRAPVAPADAPPVDPNASASSAATPEPPPEGRRASLGQSFWHGVETVKSAGRILGGILGCTQFPTEQQFHELSDHVKGLIGFTQAQVDHPSIMGGLRRAGQAGKSVAHHLYEAFHHALTEPLKAVGHLLHAHLAATTSIEDARRGLFPSDRGTPIVGGGRGVHHTVESSWAPELKQEAARQLAQMLADPSIKLSEGTNVPLMHAVNDALLNYFWGAQPEAPNRGFIEKIDGSIANYNVSVRNLTWQSEIVAGDNGPFIRKAPGAPGMGTFNGSSVALLRNFQRHTSGLTETGELDQATLKKLMELGYLRLKPSRGEPKEPLTRSSNKMDVSVLVNQVRTTLLPRIREGQPLEPHEGIRQFQRVNGLPATGVLDNTTSDLLTEQATRLGVDLSGMDFAKLISAQALWQKMVDGNPAT